MAIFFGIAVPFFSFGATTATTTSLLFNPIPVIAQLYCPTAYCDLESMMLLVIKSMLAIIPITSVLFIVVGGFQLVVSGGNEEKIIQGKKTILWAIMGLVFAFLSFSIIAIVQNFLEVRF